VGIVQAGLRHSQHQHAFQCRLQHPQRGFEGLETPPSEHVEGGNWRLCFYEAS